MQVDTGSQRLLLQDAIDAFSDHVAVTSRDGIIVCVNDAWRQFCSANGGNRNTFYVGQNYHQICREAHGDGVEIASRIDSGLSRVLKEGLEFSAEYPCHSPAEKRWFIVVARPLMINGQQHALVAHRNVTTEKSYKDELNHADQDLKNQAAILSTMPDALIAFDMKGHIINWNAAASKLYGYERDEVLGETLEILYPPGWPKSINDYIDDVVVNGRQNFEAVRITKSGQPRSIEITAAPIRSTSGEIIGVSNIHHDVTGLREANSRLRRILDNLFAFVGVLDLDGTLLEANRAPLEAAGIEEKDVIGKKFWDCYWWNYSAHIQTQLQDACDRARNGEVVRHDVKVRVAGDRLLWIDFQISALLSSDGQVVNLVASGIDISERKAASASLIASHDSFQNMVRGSPFGIYTVDADFRIAHVSDGAQKAFANVRPLIGRDLGDVLHILWPDEFATEAIERFQHTLSTGERYRSARTTEKRLDIDEVESYDWMIERITMPDGRLGVVCNFYDLSERQKYEEHISLLMREVNHRSKNLLAIVISMARQTAKDVSPQEFGVLFSLRLQGLAASQDLIVRGNWEGVTMRGLALSQLEHLGLETLDERIKLVGPEIIITPQAAQGIGMAFHELSTNALKYGALKTNSGSVCISWNIDSSEQSIQLFWTECDGPSVTPPKKNGFGRIVIEKMAAASVGGSVTLEYLPEGVRWMLTAQLSNILVHPDG